MALLLHGALLLAMPHGVAKNMSPPSAPLMVSLLDPAPAQAAPSPPAPPQVIPPKPRVKPRPVRPKPIPRKTEPARVPVPVPEPVASAPEPEYTESAESSAPQVAAAEVSTASGSSQAAASSVFTAARFDAGYLHNPKPPYPKMSKSLHEEGTVTLRAYVLPNGSAEKVEIKRSSGSARLDEAARAAVAKWRFEPARQGNEPVSSWVLIPFTWSLKES
ncbi:MAG: energy transducer TonB [Azoarcus sp.]|nr:energy transducer TonB [Azoarcus sp.]